MLSGFLSAVMIVLVGGGSFMMSVGDNYVYDDALDLSQGEFLSEDMFTLVEDDFWNVEDVVYECIDLKYDLLEGYVEDDGECYTFMKSGLEDTGLFYYFSTYNPETLDNYNVEYEDDKVRVYKFVNDKSLEDLIFGEVNFRICNNKGSDYFLIEADTVRDDNLELDIDRSDHMNLVDFASVCSSLNL